jgi:hypothetical protein
MHSSELPVTEYWDPADDVYAVPPCPQGSGYDDADTWTEAFLFSATIEWIWADYDGYWGPWTRELTTGCRCRDKPGWYPGRPDNPACPVHGRCPRPSDPVGFETPPPPCTCRYGLRKIADAPGPWEEIRNPGIRRTVLFTRCFLIDRDCTHHGDATLTYPRFWDTLDEDERRGH